jgi:hypothetical protein
MSIKVSKILNINSIDYLYKILKDNDELVIRDNTFQVFLDHMDDYYHGCKCMEDEYLSFSKKEYTKISKNDEIISLMKENFNCDDIVFA